MGEVLVVFKLLPEDSDTDMDALKNSVKESLESICEINTIEEMDIGYGLKAVKLSVIVPDEEGKIGAVEDKLHTVKGVGQIDTEDVTLT